MSALPKDEPRVVIIHGQDRAQYLARMSAAEWMIWMGLGGPVPAEIGAVLRAEMKAEAIGRSERRL